MAVGGQPPKPRKGRLALISGAVVVALVLTAGGVLAVTNGWFGRAGGASSPEAAANSFLRSAVKLDGGDILAAFPPSERALVAEVVDLVENQSRTDAQARSDAVDGARSALSISMPTAPVFATEELVPGVAKARITGGTLRLDGDPDQLADALMSIMDASGVPAETLVAREQLRADLATELPVDMELTDLVSIAGVDDFFVVSVEEGGKWYISLTMTLAQYAAEAAGVTKDRLGHVIPPQEMKTFSNPDDAVVGLFNAINQAVNTGDTTELAKVLPPAESRLVAVYGPVLFGEPRNAGDTQSPFAVSDLSASTLQTKGDHAWVALDTFTIDLGAASTVKYARDGKKYTITGLDHNTEVLTVVLDGNDPRKWSFTMTDDSEDYTGSLSIPVPGQLAGEYFRTFTWPYLDDPFVQSASFLFDGTCVTLTYDGDSEPADCLPETVSWLDNVDTFPDMARLLSVTTLKSGDSWYASPSATLISFGTELARTFGS
ncbi:MAG: hypothetical protein FWE61_03090 [Micrococcales bacterium]|nr:hypothetical protein [Micrococcales bacterium]